MRETLARYKSIPSSVRRFIAAEQLLVLVHVALFLVFNLHLRALGHSDAFIARVTSFRYLGVLALALPAGLWLRGRAIKPLLVAAALLVPVSTLVMVSAANAGLEWLLAWSMLAFGVGHMALQVAAVPLIVREAPDNSAPEAISLSFATFPVAMLSCGLLVPGLHLLDGVTLGGWRLELDDARVIRLVALLALGAIPLVLSIRESPPPIDTRHVSEENSSRYDWGLIARAMAPNLFIAVGAGLTIPFVSLFFNAVFQLDAAEFSMLGGAAGILVICGSLANPAIRRRFGYRVAVVAAQALSVSFLVLLALTELFAQVPGVFWLAAVCYLLRQPLMNMAGPITSELAMSYVGPRNRELIAALHTSIWSGGWFLSARIFQKLREAALPYWSIFLITAALYATGVLLYAVLIRDHERRLARPA